MRPPPPLARDAPAKDVWTPCLRDWLRYWDGEIAVALTPAQRYFLSKHRGCPRWGLVTVESRVRLLEGNDVPELSQMAEGIEDRDTLELLLAAGCTQGQGYYFSPPLRPAASASGSPRTPVAPPPRSAVGVSRHHPG